MHLATKNRPIRSSYVCSNYVTLQHYNYFFKRKSANIFTVLLEFPILNPLGIITYSKGRRGPEAFSIHPSVPSSIHGWHHTGKKTLAEINNPRPLCACVTV